MIRNPFDYCLAGRANLEVWVAAHGYLRDRDGSRSAGLFLARAMGILHTLLILAGPSLPTDVEASLRSKCSDG